MAGAAGEPVPRRPHAEPTLAGGVPRHEGAAVDRRPAQLGLGPAAELNDEIIVKQRMIPVTRCHAVQPAPLAACRPWVLTARAAC